MDADAVGSITDEKELPSVNQCYLIPSSFRNKAAPMHDKAVFSIWNHVNLFLMIYVLLVYVANICSLLSFSVTMFWTVNTVTGRTTAFWKIRSVCQFF